MTTDMNTEATVGVMRHVASASPYAIEYLFTKRALHLKEAGFRSLSLGIAPLSGNRIDAAGIALAPAGGTGVAFRRAFLQLPRIARIQEQVPAALGAALFGGIRIIWHIFHFGGPFSLLAGGWRS